MTVIKSSDYKCIMPVKPLLRDIFLNIWHLRLIVLIVLIILIISNVLLWTFETKGIESNTIENVSFFNAILISIDTILPSNTTDYAFTSTIGNTFALLNSIIGYIMLGFIIWILQESMKDQPLRKRK